MVNDFVFNLKAHPKQSHLYIRFIEVALQENALQDILFD